MPGNCIAYRYQKKTETSKGLTTETDGALAAADSDPDSDPDAQIYKNCPNFLQPQEQLTYARKLHCV